MFLYGKPRPDRGNKKVPNNFLRTENLAYMCRMIHNVLLNIVMSWVGSREYVSDKDCFCMYKVMVGEKVNLLEIIFFYWM